jgi:capsular exopolysaccharide synthesis family protein
MKKELITYKNPKSPIAETFRTLRTNIQFMNTKKNLQSILITSTMPGEGKSWVSANLATTFAQAGKKVILIDVDMRKGTQHKMFTVESRPGLSNYLLDVSENETVDILQYVKRTGVENLYLITCGNVPPNPSELLASEGMINMVEKLKRTFDILIFDGTPGLIVTDAMIVSRLVDTTIIVASHNETKKDNLQKVKKGLESVGASVAGVVINKMPVNAKKYEDSYYYGNTPNKMYEEKDIFKKKTRQMNKEEKVLNELNELFNNRKEQ